MSTQQFFILKSTSGGGDGNVLQSAAAPEANRVPVSAGANKTIVPSPVTIDADTGDIGGVNDMTIEGTLDISDAEFIGTLPSAAIVSVLTSKKQRLDGALGTNLTYDGVDISGLTAGASLSQFDAVYVSSSSTLLKADSDGSGTYPARGLAAAAYSNTDPAILIVKGPVRNNAWNWTPGGTIYLSSTAGGLTQTEPSATGEAKQPVGFALTADIAYFDFSTGFTIVGADDPPPEIDLIVDETFEGVGEPSGWSTTSGTPHYDNTSAPLAGAEDLKMDGSAATDCMVTFAGADELFIKFRFKTSVLAGSPFVYITTAASQYLSIGMNGGALRINQANTQVAADTADTIAANTDTFVWLHVVKGTGADAFYELSWNTIDSRPTSGNKYTANASDGTHTEQFTHFNPYHAVGETGAFQFDNLQISVVDWPN